MIETVKHCFSASYIRHINNKIIIAIHQLCIQNCSYFIIYSTQKLNYNEHLYTLYWGSDQNAQSLKDFVVELVAAFVMTFFSLTTYTNKAKELVT